MVIGAIQQELIGVDRISWVLKITSLVMRSMNGELSSRLGPGYEDQKRQIEDTILLALLHPDVYEGIAAGTRARPVESVRPRAVLFEGPPGCGKTTSARRADPFFPFLPSDHVVLCHWCIRWPEKHSVLQSPS